MTEKPRILPFRGSEESHEKWINLLRTLTGTPDRTDQSQAIMLALGDPGTLETVTALCKGWGQLTEKLNAGTLQSLLALYSLLEFGMIEASETTHPEFRGSLPILLEELREHGKTAAIGFDQQLQHLATQD